MKCIATTMGLLALLLIPTFARAEEPQATEQESTGGEVIPLQVPDEEPVFTPEEKPLHDAGAKAALDMICGGDDKCEAKYGEKVIKAASAVVDACLEDPEVPKYMCMAIVVNASIEAGLAEHPTCGGISKECVLKCDKLPNGGGRQACFISCAKDEGIGGDKLGRVKACNDKGTSKGPFQMKDIRIGQCRRLQGAEFDPFDLGMATKCTLAIIKRTALSPKFPCGRGRGDRWMIAMKRVTAGPSVVVQAAAPPQCLPSPLKNLPEVCTPATPEKRETQCGESGYAETGFRYYQKCGKKCAKWVRPEVAPPNVTQDP